MRAALLDEKIKLKRDLKKILTADQYKKYEEKLEAKNVRKDKPQLGRFVRKQK